MSNFYKIVKADPLGEPWESHGKTMQTYWCQVEGQDKSVSITKQEGNSLYPGQHVYGDLLYAKSQKGTEYWKFKGAQVPEGVQRPQDTPATQAPTHTPVQEVGGQIPGWFLPIANQIDYIYKQMKAMDDTATRETEVAVDRDPEPPEPPSTMPPDFLVAGDAADENIDKTRIVFGG